MDSDMMMATMGMNTATTSSFMGVSGLVAGYMRQPALRLHVPACNLLDLPGV
jgi:hypothetical protein